MDKVLINEVAQVAKDLTTKSVFSMSVDLPLIGDALKRLVSVLSSLDARVTALEKHLSTPATPPVPVNAGSKPAA